MTGVPNGRYRTIHLPSVEPEPCEKQNQQEKEEEEDLAEAGGGAEEAAGAGGPLVCRRTRIIGRQ